MTRINGMIARNVRDAASTARSNKLFTPTEDYSVGTDRADCANCGKQIQKGRYVGMGWDAATHVDTGYNECDPSIGAESPRAALAVDELPELLPCRRCGKLVGAKKVIGGYENVHAATGERQCIVGDWKSGMASPVDHCRKCAVIGENHSHCPKCSALEEFSVVDTMWGIDSKCTACGYKSYYSLGD